MREADRIDIYTGRRVNKVVREGLTEEVKLEAFTSGKEKEIFHAERTVHVKTQNMAHSGNGRCSRMDIRKSHFSNTLITHNFPFAKCNIV